MKFKKQQIIIVGVIIIAILLIASIAVVMMSNNGSNNGSSNGNGTNGDTNGGGTSVAAFGWELNGITQEIKGKIYRLDFKERLAKNIADLIDENGNRASWSHKHDLIAISKTKENGT